MSGHEITSTADLANMMLASLQPQTATTATPVIEAFLQSPNSLPALGEILQSYDDPSIRQQAAVFLLQAMRHWSNTAEDVRASMRDLLLEVAATDANHLVRRNAAEVVVKVGQRALLLQRWPTFLDTVHGCTQSENAVHREAGFFILMRLVKFFGENDKSFFEQLAPLCVAGLSDPESLRVRHHSFAAIAGMTAYSSTLDEVVQFQSLLPQMHQCILDLIGASEETAVISCLGAYEDMISITPQMANKQWPMVVGFLLDVFEAPIEAVRIRCLSFLIRLAEVKVAALIKYDLVGRVLNAAFAAIVCEGDMEDGLSLPTTAGQLVDRMCLVLAPQYTFEPGMAMAQECGVSEDPCMRRGAAYVLAMMAEGAQEPMRESLSHVMEMVVAFCQDSHPMVRHGGANALVQCVRFLKPTIVEEYHETIAGAAVAMMGEASADTVRVGCLIVDEFVDSTDAQYIAPYIEVLLQNLVSVIENSPRSVQIHAVTAIGGIAYATTQAFVPYFDSVMELFGQMIELEGDEDLDLRGRAIEAVGACGFSVGIEHFGPYLEHSMEVALAGLSLEYPMLREYIYSFFAKVASLLGQDFAQYAETVLTIACRVCSAPDMAVFTGEVFVDIGDDEEGLASELEDQYEVPTAVQEEKGAAVALIGSVADALGPQFVGYAQHCLDSIENLIVYDNYEVRCATLSACYQIARAVGMAFDTPQWVPGLPVAKALPESVASVIDYLVPHFLLRVHQEEAVDVVSRALDMLGALLHDFGPVVFADEHNYELFTVCCTLILTKESVCQMPIEDSDDDEETEAQLKNIESPIDLAILETDTLGECIESAAKALGPAFFPAAQQLLPHLSDRCRVQRPVYERACAMGVISSIVDALSPESLVELGGDLFPLFLGGITDSEEEVRRNACFGVGLMMESGMPQFEQLLETVVGALIQSYQMPSKTNFAFDNATGALARIVVAYKSNAELLQSVIPVFVNALPLTADLDENQSVYSALFTLFQDSNQETFERLPAIMRVFASDVFNSHLSPAIGEQLVALLQALVADPNLGEHIPQMIEDENHRNALLSLLQ